MKIICGTDFRAHAAEAADAAAALARRFDDILFLAHVLENGPGSASSGQVSKLVQSHVEKSLGAEAERLRNQGAIVRERLLTGSAHQALVREASHVGTRMVVISSLGKVAPSRFLVGSVAERTAESSPVPTLVVHDAKPFTEWLNGRPLRIFVGYDFSTTADVALQWVNALARAGPCEVTVGYAAYVPEEYQRLGLTGGMPLFEDRPELLDSLERELRGKVSSHLTHTTARIFARATWGKPDAVLLEMAKAAEADLIVVGTHQRQGLQRYWLGSISRGVLRHAGMSVAVVPPKAVTTPAARPIPKTTRVLIATDLSAVGNTAIPHGYGAVQDKGNVCLLHVLPVGRGSSKAGNAKKVETARKQLKTLVPEEAGWQGLETTIEVVEHRDPAEAICQAAERFGADIICLASHGRTGLARSILGSVAASVVGRSTRPLLIVRPPRK